MQKVKIQWYLFLVFVLNVVYNALPFFAVKNIFLRMIGIRVGRRTYIHTPVKFFALRHLTIGGNSTINPRCYLDARRGISIGNNVNIAHGTKIYTLGHDVTVSDVPLVGKSVSIEDDAFIFANVMIMPGVTIGEGAVVFPGSVVVKDVPPYTVVGGNPAVVIRERPRLRFALTDYGYWFAQ